MKRHSYTSLRGRSTFWATLLALWLTPLAAGAQTSAEDRWFGGSEAYELCLAAIDTDAEQAFERAITWRDQGGGPPARHCAALALMELGQYGDAADRLDRLAQDLNNGLGGPLRAQVLVQAANAWMLEGFPDQGIESLDAARSLGVQSNGISAQIYFDRARAQFMLEDWQAAADDLSRALDYAPGAKDARTLRARAHRLEGNGERAMADLTRVLSDDPDYAPALLERGLLYRDQGEVDQARADWIKVLQLESEGDLLRAAQLYLQELDFPEGL